MNLTTVIPAAHNKGLTLRIANAAKECSGLSDVVVFDNGVGRGGRLGTGTNVGNYAVFHRSANDLSSDLILFIHNDLIIYEHGFDQRLIEAFANDPRLGLVGFVASNEIDAQGGRGLGTRSNYQGNEPGTSPAETHGMRERGFCAAAVVDGAAMCFRRDALLDCPELDFPPHHFYDKMFSCQMLERGWHVGYLGVACDHKSGQTANEYKGYHDLAREWCEEHDCVRTGNPDQDVYLEAERRFLTEYRDEKRFIPLKVGPDHEIYHTHSQAYATP
ncbi:MAG: hypothetical protein GWN53_17165 [Gammaproteobacteria bacterium]|uniref:Streptomycin biosynthesis protein StrF domain-containing protein n=1 Tax=Candidatus Kutchimonas denitrificans TaxID=3056748 RepID=A0AAE4ZAF0_9BACT|nr:hypothetical protein [Candidatus Kutchimonas denitrificans]NIV53572.1 hypothetical protein [Gammaproteobacteria bacterium]